jgi:hypothetical protein
MSVINNYSREQTQKTTHQHPCILSRSQNQMHGNNDSRVLPGALQESKD